MLLIHIFSTNISLTKLQMRWKKREDFWSHRSLSCVIFCSRTSGDNWGKLPVTYRYLHSVTRERYLGLNKIKKEFLTRNNYSNINDDQWINEFAIWLGMEWFLHQLNHDGIILIEIKVIWLNYAFNAQSMLHDAQWCMLGWNKIINNIIEST